MPHKKVSLRGRGTREERKPVGRGGGDWVDMVMTGARFKWVPQRSCA